MGLTYRRERSSILTGGQPASGILCKFNMVGKCNRNPCRFLHIQPPTPKINPEISSDLPENRPRKNPNFSSQKTVWTRSGPEDGITHSQIRKIPMASSTGSVDSGDKISTLTSSTGSVDSGDKRSTLASPTGSVDSGDKINTLATSTRNVDSGDKISTLKTPPKVCQNWLSGNCVKGDNCQFMHSWFCGNGISMLARLDGHKKAVSGIALPLGSDKLYSASRDGIVTRWDCHTGKSAGVIDLGDEVGCLICEGPWVFIGMPNVVKAWNTESSTEFSLNGPVGQVYCMVTANEMLFAGAENGGILAWRGSPGTENPFHLAGSLRGHSHVVTCLAVGGKMLYSGSMDNTIRVWDVDTLQSVMTLNGHIDTPMSLLCWDQYLLSCSLDQTIKVWATTEGGNLEVTYTHNEEHGVLVLCGMNDAVGQPVLLCGCNDNSTCLYELPSFTERGRIFSKREVREIQTGPDGLFFTGDGTGMLSVWKLLAKSSGVAELV